MSKKILLVDDDVELCQELAEMLQARHWRVQTVFEGSQVPELITKHSYDVILLDYKIPGLNGIEILETLRNRQDTPRIFLMSGRPYLDALLSDPAIKGLIAGRVRKPFDPAELLKQIEDVMEMAS